MKNVNQAKFEVIIRIHMMPATVNNKSFFILNYYKWIGHSLSGVGCGADATSLAQVKRNTVEVRSLIALYTTDMVCLRVFFFQFSYAIEAFCHLSKFELFSFKNKRKNSLPIT